MSLSEVDRQLLDRCLEGSPRAWEDFVDRFLGLVLHVVHHTASGRSITLTAEQRDDLVADVFLALVDKDYATLRRFQRNCSLATYLTVIARRTIVRQLLARSLGAAAVIPSAPTIVAAEPALVAAMAASGSHHETRIEDRDQVEQLLARLDPHEADVVRMYHLEGKSYGEISQRIGMPENSVGPLLSRARAKLRSAQA